jgi:hypothetical protein
MRIQPILIGSLLFSLFVAAPAVAAPVRSKNGEAINVRVAGKHARGIGLRAQTSGWRLELAGGARASASLFDVTDGVLPTRWVVQVVDGALELDAARFVAGHAYRLELRGADSAIIYLYPPKGARASHVELSDDEQDLGDEGIAITPKSAL